jgi:hypothetical protein
MDRVQEISRQTSLGAFRPGVSKLSSFPPESVLSLRRNSCPVSTGMGDQFGPESLSSLGRNTHFCAKWKSGPTF